MGTAPSRGGRAAGGREPPPSPRRGASLPPSQRAGGRGRGPTEIGLSLHELGCRDWSQPQGRVSSTWETPNVSKDATLAEKMLGFFWAYRAILGGSTVCPQGVSWGIRVEPLWAVAPFQHTSEVPNWGEAPPRTREASVRCQGSQNHPIRWWLWSVINKPRTLGWRNTFPCLHLRNPRLLIRACVSFP